MFDWSCSHIMMSVIKYMNYELHNLHTLCSTGMPHEIRFQVLQGCVVFKGVVQNDRTLAQGCQPPCKDVKLSHFFFQFAQQKHHKTIFQCIGCNIPPSKGI